MRTRLVIPFAALLLVATMAAGAAAQDLPARAGTFVLADSSRDERAGEGVVHTYHNEGEAGRAFVYRLRRTLPEGEQLAAEADSLIASLEAGRARGWYSAVRIVVNEARTFETGDGPRPGHLLAAVLHRGEEEALVSFMHLVLLGDQYVRTRLTLPANQWRTSLAPNFAIDLFRELRAPAP